MIRKSRNVEKIEQKWRQVWTTLPRNVLSKGRKDLIEDGIIEVWRENKFIRKLMRSLQ